MHGIPALRLHAAGYSTTDQIQDSITINSHIAYTTIKFPSYSKNRIVHSRSRSNNGEVESHYIEILFSLVSSSRVFFIDDISDEMKRYLSNSSLLLSILLAELVLICKANGNHHQYCIIGAGPSGEPWSSDMLRFVLVLPIARPTNGLFPPQIGKRLCYHRKGICCRCLLFCFAVT